jgi:hypothetical protein
VNEEMAEDLEPPPSQRATIATLKDPTTTGAIYLKRKRDLGAYKEEMLLLKSAARAPSLEIYTGKSLDAHHNFMRECDIVFQMNPLDFRIDEQKVLYVIAYYRGEARTRWDAFEKQRGQNNTN